MKFLQYLLLIPAIVFGQNYSGEITYSIRGVYNASQSTLVFNKNESLYNHVLYKDKKKAIVKSDDDKNNINISVDPNYDLPNNKGLYNNLKKRLLIESLYMHTDVNSKSFDIIYIKEKTNNIAWEIKDETKKIDKFVCQKAIGNFRGRTYTVWFTNEIPVSFGPWKLNGLPGLIIEAVDNEGKFYFKAEKIIQNTKVNIQESDFVSNKYITPLEYRKRNLDLITKYKNALSEKIRAALPRGANSSSNGNGRFDENNFIERNFDDLK